MQQQSKPKTASAFSKLHERKSRRVKTSRKMSKTLMALSAENHKAIALLLAHWIDKSG